MVLCARWVESLGRVEVVGLDVRFVFVCFIVGRCGVVGLVFG